MTQRGNVDVRTVRSPVVNALAIAAFKKKEADDGGIRVPLIKRLPVKARISGIAGISGNNPRQNQILASLPAGDYERLLPFLEFVPMPVGSTLCAVGMQMQYIYFPTSCIVSLLSDTKDGTSVETAVVGNEGLVGVSLFMGEGICQSRAVVKIAGHGYRLNARMFKQEFGRGGILQHSSLRYTHALLTQTSQTAVCNRHHTIIQQFCRWLLLSLDRLPTTELNMTQELIANMLGVRRESITQAAEVLQKEGLIVYWRGHISVVNRAGLERRVCECYAGVKKVYDHLRVVEEKTAA